MASAPERIAALEAVCAVKCAEVAALASKVDKMDGKLVVLHNDAQKRLGFWGPLIGGVVVGVILKGSELLTALFRGVQP